MPNIKNMAGFKVQDTCRTQRVKHWDSPRSGSLKWHIDASKLSARHNITISFVCRDNLGRVQYLSNSGYPRNLESGFRDYPEAEIHCYIDSNS